MRIPHIINENTLTEYKPSPQTLELIGENERQIKSEDFEWNKNQPLALVDWCVIALSKSFHRNPVLDELPCVDHEHILELITCDLELTCAIPKIEDEYYWQRRYAEKFGLVTRRKPPNWTWKSLYLERHVQKILEEAQPQYGDEESFDEILDLCAPYVRRLILTQLQSWKPPLTMDKEDIPEVYPIDHINFNYVLKRLPLINEFDLIYGVNEVGEDFNWNMFKVSVADCEKLGKALLDLPELTILRIHRSKIEYPHCQALMQQLIRNNTIVELDLSNCEIGDKGALCVAELLSIHFTLKVLNLANNNIRQIGAEGISFAMLQQQCADLDILNLRLNPLEDPGVMAILTALVRCGIPRELSMAGCQFGDDTPDSLALMLKMNETLKKLDIRNNWLGEEGGNKMLDALEVNVTLEYLDVRDTDITQSQQMLIEKCLLRNRGQYEGVEEEEEEPEERKEEYDGEEEVKKVTEYENQQDDQPSNA